MKRLYTYLKDIWYTFCLELHRIFNDTGVLVIFFAAGLLYPLLYSSIYHKNNLEDVPVAVVDEDDSADSRRFINKLDATPDVKVAYHCVTMSEAEKLFRQHKVHGVIYFPNDYSSKLANLEQAYMSLYCDMSSFLYYRSVYMGTNFVMLDEMKSIGIKRYNLKGMNGEDAAKLVEALPYEGVDLFLSSQGFSCFLLPAILILILHQTLVIGVAMLCGTAYEEGKHFLPKRLRHRGVHRVVLGRSTAYLVIYAGLAAYGMILIPHLFHLPQMASVTTLFYFALPFLLATTFFALTIGNFIRNRETGVIYLAPLTVILLFISGFAWPQSNVPLFWQWVGYIFPSTFAIKGYVSINTMGATLAQIRPLLVGLWVQAGAYFLTAILAIKWSRSRRMSRIN